MMIVLATAAALVAGPACDAAGLTLDLGGAGGERILFSEGAPNSWARPILIRSDLAAGWRGRAPSAALLTLFMNADQRGALECSAVRERALRKGGLIRDDEVIPLLDRERLKAPRIAVHRLTMPILSPDGRQALYVRSVATNQMGGDAWVVFLERVGDGGWREVGRKLLYQG